MVINQSIQQEADMSLRTRVIIIYSLSNEIFIAIPLQVSCTLRTSLTYAEIPLSLFVLFIPEAELLWLALIFNSELEQPLFDRLNHRIRRSVRLTVVSRQLCVVSGV